MKKIEKDLKRLRRSELIEVIYQLKKNEEMLEERIKALEAELQDKNIKIEKAGSIAEAAMSLTDIFSTAQRVADIYLEEIYRRYKAVETEYVPSEKVQKEAVEQNASADSAPTKSDRFRRFSGSDAEAKSGSTRRANRNSAPSSSGRASEKRKG